MFPTSDICAYPDLDMLLAHIPKFPKAARHRVSSFNEETRGAFADAKLILGYALLRVQTRLKPALLVTLACGLGEAQASSAYLAHPKYSHAVISTRFN
jgi:hypothetical protein